MSNYLRYTNLNDLASFQNRRLSETHVADVIMVPDQEKSYLDNLESAQQRGVEFVILGIPEDIGPRANCGKGGAKNAWHQYLPVMLSQQANQFFNWGSVLLLGELDVSDLQKQSNVATISDHKLSSLRDLCAQLDSRVEELLLPIFKLGLKTLNEVFIVDRYDYDEDKEWDENREWISILISKNNFSFTSNSSIYIKGYIHKSRVRFLEDLPIYNGKKFSFAYQLIPFTKKKANPKMPNFLISLLKLNLPFGISIVLS